MKNGKNIILLIRVEKMRLKVFKNKNTYDILYICSRDMQNILPDTFS